VRRPRSVALVEQQHDVELLGGRQDAAEVLFRLADVLVDDEMLPVAR
jgi:hypothetical protein